MATAQITNNFYFSITGNFENRDRIEKLLPNYSTNVNRKTSFLVVANEPKEGKINEAKLNNIPLVSPSILDDLINNKFTTVEAYKIHNNIHDNNNNNNNNVDVKQEDEEDSNNKRKRKSVSKFGDFVMNSIGSKRRKENAFEGTSKSFSTTTTSRKPPQNEWKSKVIALEGQIGVGKSTLCNKFERSFPDLCSAYKEQTNENFLKLFYSDPKKYGFAFQWGMLKTRVYQLQLAQIHAKHPENPPKQFYFWDRSMLGDYMFALWNHLLGGISKEEMNVYESEFGGSFKKLKDIPFLGRDINCFVLLNDEPSQCKFRVEQHRKNESEQGIPLSYYEGIDDMHYNIFIRLLKEKVGPTLVINWGEYHDTNTTLTNIKNVADGKKQSPTVEVITFQELSNLPNDRKSVSFVYTKAQEIIDHYDELKEMNDIQNVRDAQYVYVPKDIMKVDPKEKGIIDNDYELDFYRNEYKRVVLYHLSRFQNIVFYSNPSDS